MILVPNSRKRQWQRGCGHCQSGSMKGRSGNMMEVTNGKVRLSDGQKNCQKCVLSPPDGATSQVAIAAMTMLMCGLK